VGNPDVVVIGGGIVGLATARALALSRGADVLLLEAESTLAAHQTGHNSGVVHSGLYYRPGSRKAELCTAGRRALEAYVAERGLAYERCGKVVTALAEAELPRLDELERRGRANGLTGIERLDAAGIRAREPHAAGIAGLFVAETGIVDYVAVARAFADDLAAAGSRVRPSARVDSIAAGPRGVEVRAGGERISAGFLVACAGLESDRLARAAGLDPGVRIVPFRGDYYALAPAARPLVRGLIYPVPDPELPFLGVHFTRRVDGEVEAGPNAVLAWKRAGYSRTAFSARDAAATLGFPGFWKMAPRYARTGFAEYRRAWSRSAFVAALRRLLPELEPGQVRRAGCGVRAQALDRGGRLLDDFVFAEGERMLHVLNAPSPAATASLAIGEEIAARAAAQLAMSA
jgi:L-2-hydroxyglutarate oxidase